MLSRYFECSLFRFPQRQKKISPSSIQWTVFEMDVLVCSNQLSAPNKNTHLTAGLNWSLEECNGGKGSALADWRHPFVPLTASSCVLIHKAPLKWHFQPCCSVLYSRQFTGEENLPCSKQRTGSPNYSTLFKRTDERLISQWKIKSPVRMPSPLVWLLP